MRASAPSTRASSTRRSKRARKASLSSGRATVRFGAAAERQVHRSCRAGCRRSARAPPISVATWSASARGDAGALEHAGEAVAAAERGAQVDDRPLGRCRPAARPRRSAPSAGRCRRRRRAARSRARATSSNWASASGAGETPGSGSKPGAERPGGVAKRAAGDEAAEPFAASRCAGRDRRRDRNRRRARAASSTFWPKAGRGARRREGAAVEAEGGRCRCPIAPLMSLN